ncbi:hypothetical protein J3A98_002967 [Pseudomonas sp. BP6]|nr:hypothetical protein [Pseudomonas sp. BP6]
MTGVRTRNVLRNLDQIFILSSQSNSLKAPPCVRSLNLTLEYQLLKNHKINGKIFLLNQESASSLESCQA